MIVGRDGRVGVELRVLTISSQLGQFLSAECSFRLHPIKLVNIVILLHVVASIKADSGNYPKYNRQ